MKTLLVSGLVILVAAGLLALVRRERRRRPDPVWQPSGVVQRFAGYDEARGARARQRARQQFKRRYAGATARQAPADVVAIADRRRAR